MLTHISRETIIIAGNTHKRLGGSEGIDGQGASAPGPARRRRTMSVADDTGCVMVSCGDGGGIEGILHRSLVSFTIYKPGLFYHC